MDWAEKHDQCRKTYPVAGTILKTESGDLARIDVELPEGQPPFLYGRAVVLTVVGTEPRWVLQPMNNRPCEGLKCILLPRARTKLLEQHGLQESVIGVEGLKVVRLSSSGKSLLCEVL